MRTMAQRLPAVDAWELWNEQDGAEFWLGGPDPAAYAALLKATYPAIKSVQPGDIVVTGGMVGNDMDFMEALYAHGAKGSFDAVGVHTDTACLVDGPDFNYRDEQGRIDRYVFSGYREVHAVMARHGDGAKPIWMTELGWNTQTTAPGSCNVGMWAGQKPLGVAEAKQAEFLAPGLPLPRRRPDRRRGALVRHAGHPGLGARGRLRPLPRRRVGQARGRPRSARSTAASPPQACGGMIDTSGPQILVAKPLDGLKFVDMIDIDAKAVDRRRRRHPPDRVLRRRQVRALVRRRRTRSISPWWDSRYWKRGKHMLTFKAEDEAGNKTSKTIAVYKVRRLPKVRTAAALALEQLDAGHREGHRRRDAAARRTPRRSCAARRSSCSRSRPGASGRRSTSSAPAPAGPCRVTKTRQARQLARVPELPRRQGLQEVALQAGPLHASD